MDEDEDDDIYAPPDDSNGVAPGSLTANTNGTRPSNAIDDLEDGEEEGEEVEEDASDSVLHHTSPDCSRF